MWAEQHRPDLLRALNGTHPGGIVVLMIAFAVLLTLMASIATYGNSPPSWRDDARELVKKGVAPEDHGRALQILLRKEFEGNGEIFTVVPIWYKFSLIALVIIGILLCVQATTAFDLGKGKASVRWQKWYGGFLRKTIPAFLFVGVAAAVVGSYAYESPAGSVTPVPPDALTQPTGRSGS
jgi:hypothetical protein